MEALLSLDGNILLWIQENLRNDLLTPILVFLTTIGNAGIFWIVTTIVCFCFKKTRQAGVVSAIALVLSLLFCNILLKNAVQRIRPYEVIDALTILVQKPSDFSFPSGHSSASFASAVALYRNLPKRFGVPAMILASVIALSRLYIGVHYPTDVICGVILGAVLAVLAEKIYQKVLKR